MSDFRLNPPSTSILHMCEQRRRGCADSPEPSLVAYVISTIISWPGSSVIARPLSVCHRLHRIARWPSARKELSSSLSACAAVLYAVLIVYISFPYGEAVEFDYICSGSLLCHLQPAYRYFHLFKTIASLHDTNWNSYVSNIISFMTWWGFPPIHYLCFGISLVILFIYMLLLNLIIIIMIVNAVSLINKIWWLQASSYNKHRNKLTR